MDFKYEVTTLNAEVTEGRIVLTRAEPQDDGSIEYLFRNYADFGMGEGELDWGENVGNEI